MLDNLITSKTRLRLLVKFFLNAATEGYLRGLADELDENTNAIRKELNNLSEAGFIIRSPKKVVKSPTKPILPIPFSASSNNWCENTWVSMP
jgi:predicted ArsR family transcriptional regulator